MLGYCIKNQVVNRELVPRKNWELLRREGSKATVLLVEESP